MRTLSAWVALCLVAAGAGSAGAQEFSDQRVGQAIERGAAFLLSKQSADGSWPDASGGLQIEGKDRQVGATSLATYALLAKGMKITDPPMARALKWLEAQETGWNYAVSLRNQVWLEAVKQNPESSPHRKLLSRDARLLIEAAVAGKKKPGSYGYRVDFRKRSLDDHDNSNAQYGVLGVWAAHLLDMEVPRGYWMAVMQYWAECQRNDGGWNYKNAKDEGSSGSMTAAGLATMYVCVDAVMADKFVRCQRSEDIHPIRKGLAWFDKNYVQTLRDDDLCHRKHGDVYYYLFGVERVGLACGHKYFGKVDWYREGAKFLLAQQGKDGAWTGKWGDQMATAYAMLFLVRGQRPVLFNWLDYDGDWNNRPRALANFCRWGRTAFESDVNWQIINLKVDVTDWHDAPIVLITGSNAPSFADGDLDKLRTFVQQGGTILSIVECKGQDFDKGMREAYEKLFPAYKPEALPRDHEFFGINPKLAGGVKVSMVSNGVRPLALHSEDDLTLPWQLYAHRTSADAFDAGAALVQYVTDRQLQNRGAVSWPGEPRRADGPTVKVAPVRYEGNWNVEPLAWQRAARLLPRMCKVNVDLLPPVDVAGLSRSGAHLAVMTGTSALTVKDEDKAAIRKFVESGGTLLADAAGGAGNGGKAFAQSAEALLEEIFGPRSLRMLSSEAELYRRQDHPITKVYYARITHRLTPGNTPRLKAVLLDGRPAVIFSREDLTTALLGRTPFAIDGYRPESALEIVRNVVLTAGKVPPQDARPKKD